ncbi:D-lactate dehydrogenase [Infundibulicybe gibba]|nr:D-lactate dehydrogenase [Infundibulicybe gibba]
MKVAVFGSRTASYDITSLGAANVDQYVSFTYNEARLDRSTAILAEGHDAVCIFVNDTCDAGVLELLQKLGVKYVVLRCAGFNNVDLETAAKFGIKVARVPAYSPEAVAEFAVGMIMTVVRKYHKAFNRVREGNFLLDGLLGFNLSGKTVGIIGTGKIGLLTGKILSMGFNCNVVAFDPYPNEKAKEYKINYVPTVEELLKVSDIVSLHCPMTEGTKHILNEETLSLTKRGVIIINTSRGGLIETHALIRGLKSGHIGAIGLDVYERESEYFFADSSSKIIHDDNFARLLSFYNVFMTGHQAYLTNEALENIATTTISNLRDMERTGSCGNIVEA